MDWTDLNFFTSDSFKKIVSFLRKEEERGKVILPPRRDILNAFYYTAFENVKVVIIGQDPYHQVNPQYAHGLAFSTRPEVRPLPKSLINIFTELQNDIGVKRIDGSLIEWAEQGVLLLNSALTVVSGDAGSHSNIGWSLLLDEVVETLNDRKEHIVFILWGSHAQKWEKFIDTNKHLIIKSAHPSPMSAYRGFFGSKPFSKTNTYLEDHNITPIDW